MTLLVFFLVHCECGGENKNFEITNYAAAIKGNVNLSIGALMRRLVKGIQHSVPLRQIFYAFLKCQVPKCCVF